MKISGIICEYNPFHKGHAHLLAEARKSADFAVCVMSGHFTQRGEAAILDKFVRAKTAILGGSDLVLELPMPFSAASARYFATAGVKILSMIGVDSLVFGSESGEASALSELADYSLSDEFLRETEHTNPSEGSASAYFEALLPKGAERLLPNDILAVEYLRAIKKEKAKMEFLAVKRIGDGFSEGTLGASEYASATAIRRALLSGKTEGLGSYMPEAALGELRSAVVREEAPAALENAERAILSFFRLTAPEALAEIAGLGGGLGYRLCAGAKESRSLAELLARSSTKRYADATIQRALLNAMLGITFEDLDRGVAYSTVLAANERGRALLSSLRKQKLPLLTKPTDAESLGKLFPEQKEAILRQAEISARADALYSLCLPKTSEAGKYLRSSAVML